MAVEAYHPGTCVACLTRYPEGTLIRRHPDGWGHAVCPDPLAVDNPPCPRCFLTHSTGACDLD